MATIYDEFQQGIRNKYSKFQADENQLRSLPHKIKSAAVKHLGVPVENIFIERVGKEENVGMRLPPVAKRGKLDFSLEVGFEVEFSKMRKFPVKISATVDDVNYLIKVVDKDFLVALDSAKNDAELAILALEIAAVLKRNIDEFLS